METIQNILSKNVLEIISEESLLVKLKSGKKLKVKLGADPTKPDLHLGHAVGLRKLKDFLEAGHEIIFLIGDFTAKIGDPSGRNSMRPVLTNDEIKSNIKTWLDQVGKVIDVSRCQIRYNSEWFDKMTLGDMLTVTAEISLPNVIEREDFCKRVAEGRHIAMSETLYPIMQAYDSVKLEADVEIGGQDQKLNMLMGRDLQGAYGQDKQDIIILPLLSGTDGRKMSKSYGNYIGLNDDPSDAFGKLMSIKDEQIVEYLKLAADFDDKTTEELNERIKNGENPKNIKEKMAYRVIEMYWGAKDAKLAKDNFKKVFSRRETPDDIKTISVGDNKISLVDALVKTSLAKSNSDARRLIKQSAVKVDQSVINDEYAIIELDEEKVIKVGKRNFIKISK